MFDPSYSLEHRVEELAEQATNMYQNDKYHISIVFLIDDKQKDFTIISPKFGDHLDKIIFWHEVAFLSKRYSFTTVFSISEFWMREANEFPYKKISDLKIIGEGLMIAAISKPNEIVERSYSKNKVTGDLELIPHDELSKELNVFTPLVKQWH